MARRRVALSKEQRKLNQEKAQDALLEEVAPTIFAEGSQMAFDRLSLSFETFCSDVLDIEPLKVLLGFCDQESSAISYIKSWLSAHVVESSAPFMSLGPEEWELRRTVNAMSSCITAWRFACCSLDIKYLAPFRKQNPQTGHKYSMRFSTKNGNFSLGTNTGHISHWIATSLTQTESLSKELSFVKKESTAADLHTLINVLWARGLDLKATIETRYSMHALLAIAGTTGCRTGCMEFLCYKNFAISLVRDTAGGRSLVATIALPRVKIRTVTLRPISRELAFSTVLLPSPIFCLVSLIVAQALRDGAFGPGFMSISDLVERPSFPYGQHHIPIPWTAGFEEKGLFSLSASCMRETWNRLLILAGYREPMRFYSIRVGAGQTLDGCLTPVVRNYVLHHTGNVFAGSYQTARLAQDLVGHTFGASQTGDNSSIFQVLRQESSLAVPSAPTRLTLTEKQQYFLRTDVKDGTFSMDKDQVFTGPSPSDRRKRKSHQETWERLMLDHVRKEYICEADELALSGRPLSDMDRVAEIPRAEQSSVAIARFLSENDASNHQERMSTLSMSKAYSLLLLNFLNRSKNEVFIPTELQIPRAIDDSVKQSSPERYFCYLCPRTYARKSTLTNHVSSIHAAQEGRFAHPFPCPVCSRDTGATVIVPAGSPSWSAHIHEHHDDPRNAPSFKTQRAADFPCTQCPLGFSSSGMLARHERTRHARVRLPPRKQKQTSLSSLLPASSPSLSPDLNMLGNPRFIVSGNSNTVVTDPDLPDYPRVPFTMDAAVI